jgi:hypothetical protein
MGVVKRKSQGTQRTRRYINPAVKTAAAKSTRSACADPVGGKINTCEEHEVGLRRPGKDGDGKKETTRDKKDAKVYKSGG